MSKEATAPLPDYRLEVVEGFMRPVFDGMGPELNELMWELLPTFTAASAALHDEIRRIERGEADEWVFESPEGCITCTPEAITVEGKGNTGRGKDHLRVDLPLKEASLLLGRWLFECVWREQHIRGA